MILGILGLALSVAALVASAALRAQSLEAAYLHAVFCAVTAILIAALAIRKCRAMLSAKAPTSGIAASNAHYMGLLWSWGALTLMGTYASGVLVWKEWWHFAVAFACAAGLSLWFSATLRKDADNCREDPALLRLARYLAIIQFVGMAAVVVGLLVGGKMTRFAKLRYTDWAANNVFFFGALAIALITGYALRNNKHA